MGLSAPGLNQWYLAWCGLIPLLLLSVSAPGVGPAFLRGLSFGVCYNLVYLNWYLGLHPLTWLGFNLWQSWLLAALAWLIVSVHQGLIVGLFSGLCRLLPLAGGFIPRRVEERWHLPALIAIPLAWVLLENKLGNAHDLLGVPWSMLEYSQYRQLPLLQITSWIGGIGLGFLIVLVNVALAGILATATNRLSWKALSAPTIGAAVRQVMTVALLITLVYAFGLSSMAASVSRASENLSVLQGNINIDMQKTVHRYTLDELLRHFTPLVNRCPPGLCIWTESALPIYLKREGPALSVVAQQAERGKLDMLIGALDRDAGGRPYNSVFGITSGGRLLSTVYHKRYLVPFGEYTPCLVEYMPEWVRRLTNTPAGGGFAAGQGPAVLSLPSGKVAPLVCFETLSPELVASSVRAGGTLLVNVSDLAWFHNSMIGEQMLAFSVLRATESRRYFVFAANSGPSTIVSATGNITALSPVADKYVLTGKVAFLSEVTPFSRWFR